MLGGRSRVYAGLAELAGAAPGDQVVDLGCGSGALTRPLGALVGPTGSVLGIDPSPEMVEFCRAAAMPHCRFEVMGAEALALDSASVDLVGSALAVHHVPVESRAAVFDEAFRVVRPGGRLFVAEFAPPDNPLARALVRLLTGNAMADNPIGELAVLAADAGFTGIRMVRRRPVFACLIAEKPLLAA
jgi:ubiquinone/menaquinone biosynthesis C-methylase UbiE